MHGRSPEGTLGPEIGSEWLDGNASHWQRLDCNGLLLDWRAVLQILMRVRRAALIGLAVIGVSCVASPSSVHLLAMSCR